MTAPDWCCPGCSRDMRGRPSPCPCGEPDQEPTTPDFWDWHALGVAQGWVSQVVCDTHDGLPMTDGEMEAWEDGDDPCIPALRLWSDE